MAGRKADRLDDLERAIAERGVIHLRDAARLLDVSEMTIRRDIADAPSRFAFLGGHIMLSGQDGPYEVRRAADSHAEAKRQACATAVSLIRPDDTVFIDCGSTLLHLVDLLPPGMPLTAVCYALNTAERLSRNESVRLIVLGGLYHPASASFEGPQGLDLLGRIGINIAMLSAAGIDGRSGATCVHFHEAAVKKAVMERARTKVLVADTSKIGRVKPAHFAPLDGFDEIVTEEGRLALSDPRLVS